MVMSTMPIRQDWIINPRYDMLFFIGTPVLCLGTLLLASNYFDSAAIAWFVLAFFAVGHHLPGFMRAYGERELFSHYKPQFLVAPVVIAAFVGWSVFNGHLGFFIFLALWDMWHFFMQHYGLMRIYEVKKRKPFNLSSRLDWLLVGLWFGYIVGASPHYLVNFLERCQRYGFGLYTWIEPEYVFRLREWMLYAATVLSAVYVLNLLREKSQGVAVVWPKLLLSATTFLTVYYAYIILEDIILGYAIVAMAHDIQYYAIVWIYNNGVLKRSKELGTTFFTFLFKDGRGRIILIYSLLILAYGSIEAIGRATGSYAIYDFVKVIICTSAFMHYYYDGFIWKVRKKEFRQNLEAEESDFGNDTPKEGLRWWNLLGGRLGKRWTGTPYFLGFGGKRADRFTGYAVEVGRQFLYFGVPILFLAWTDITYSLSEVEAKEYLARLTPTVAKVYDDLGKVYTSQGDFDRAAAAHRKAIQLDPGFARAYTHLGIASSLKGAFDEALSYHQKAIEVDPGLPQAHYNLGVDYLHLGLPHKAIAAFERAIALDADYSRAYEALGRIYLEQGEKGGAEKYLEQAKRSSKAARRSALGRNALPWTTGTTLETHVGE